MDTAARKQEFMAAYEAHGGQLRLACKSMKPPMDKSTVRGWRKSDEAFKDWFEEWQALYTERFVQEFDKRALTGLTGNGMQSKMSDRLLQHAVSNREGSPYRQQAPRLGSLTIKVVREDHRQISPADPLQLTEGAVDAEFTES